MWAGWAHLWRQGCGGCALARSEVEEECDLFGQVQWEKNTVGGDVGWGREEDRLTDNKQH
jgi:hypothetical protein